MTAQDLLDGQTKHRLTVEEFLLLDREGAFGDRRTELIAGDIYYMSPQFRPHGFAKDELAYRLRRALEAMGSDIRVATEQSVDFGPHSEPQPDIILTSEPQGEGAIPGSSVLLIVEVSVTTLEFDLGVKADLYADAGVPEYWVIDVNENRVLMHANPRADGSGYDGQLDVPFGAPLHAAMIEGLTVESAGLG
ncbi:MAG: Uma2 family endonuclease [Qipengyuania sp.]|jgi:Uma2 family endonuclease|nr:Uma2 family endonuclease [Qipengyuania sp.]